MILAMKTSDNGRTAIAALLVLALLIMIAGLVYRYHRDLERYSLAPRALARQIARQPMLRHLPRARHVPICRPVPAHYTLLGSLKGRHIVTKTLPSYPTEAEMRGISTQVRLNFRVFDDGQVAPNIWVTQMGQPEFDDAAIQALRQWKFSPVRRAASGPSPASITNEDRQGEPGSINFTFTLPPPICT